MAKKIIIWGIFGNMKINELFKDEKENIDIKSYLIKCGVKNVEEYLSHNTVEDSINYKNIKDAKELILRHLDSIIYILVDCDVDGYMASSIIYLFLKRLNPKVKIKTIFHSGKQHGLADDEVMKYLETQTHNLVITPDSSSNDIKECKKLKELGWDILIGGEHHEIEKENQYAIVINNELGNTINRNGSGGLVTWHMCRYINKELVKDLISYVAISLISDSMSMIENENYTFTYWGRKKINKNLIPFIEELNKGNSETNKDYSFGMVTYCNSLIRLGNIDEKEELFYALVGEIEPHNIIKRCRYYHDKQSRDIKSLMEKVDIIYDKKAVIGKINEKTTLTGLVANKLMSEYNKPIILVYEREDGYCSGSVRSPINLKDTLNESKLFTYNQGHGCAFGTAYQLSKEQDIINYLDMSVTVSEPRTDVLLSYSIKNIPNNLYDLKMTYNELWGKGIESPIFHIKQFTIYNTDISVLGKGGTIKFNKYGIDFIMFFVSNKLKEKLKLDEIKQKLTLECIGELGWNEWNGNKKKQIMIKKIEVKPKKELTFDELFG